MTAKNIIGLNANDPIYRIIKKDYFFESLQAQRFKLFKPTNWDDPFENLFFNTFSINNHGERINHIYDRDRFYGSCWTDLFESDALWRIYSPNQEGIKIKTTAGKLINALSQACQIDPDKQAFIGKVDYLTNEEITEKMLDEEWAHKVLYDPTNKSRAETLLFKRKEFVHENEVRLLYYEAQTHQPGEYPNCFEFKFNPNELIDRIELDPRLTLKEYIKIEKKLLVSGYTNSVRKSSLYDPPQIFSRINTGTISLREAQAIANERMKE